MNKLLGEPAIVVDPAARMEEWTDGLERKSFVGGSKWKGPKKNGK